MSSATAVPEWARRPLFGRHGHLVVNGLCGWEIVALTTGLVPTVSATVRRYPAFGVALLLALTHHWYVEAVVETVVDVVEAVTG